MVFAKISTLVQTQWRLLRSALDAECRVQQRQAKMHSKQQRKAARRAAREARKVARKARRAKRKQRNTLLSPTAVGEPTDDEERPMTSSSPRGDELEISAVPGSLVWARTAEALKDVTGANESARICINEPSEGRRDASWSVQEATLECVDAVADVTSLTVAKAMPQLSVMHALEIEAEVEQTQREFYDSQGGYSTVDEEDDELPPAVLAGGQHAFDTKLSSSWTVVNIEKVAALLQEMKTVLPDATEQGETTDARTFASMAAFPSSSSKPRPKSLSSSSDLVETESEDEEVNLRDSAAFDDEEDLLINNPGINGLCVPSLDSSVTQCDGEGSIEVSETKVHPNWCDVSQDIKVENKDEEVVAVERIVDIDLIEEELPQMSIVLKKLETKESLGMHESSDEHVLEAAQPLDTKDKPSEEELVGTEFEEVFEGPKVVGRESEVGREVEISLDATFYSVEVVKQEVMIEEEESLYPADEDVLSQRASVPGSPYQSLVLSCASSPRSYSPGTVEEYGCSIYESLRTREHRYHVTEDIFAKQQSIRPKMRAVLVDWLVEVHQRFELEAQTLYLTVNYVDRYLAQALVHPQRLQLVGVAALLIASKFEEVYPCDMDDLLYICERSYSKTDLVDCERDLLNVFKFNLAVPSVGIFLGYYLEHCEKEDKLIGQLASYFAECTLLDFTFGATYEPSIVACACLLAAYCYIENQAPSLVWNYRLVELTGYAVEAIVPCTQNLSSILIQPTELIAVATKYSGAEFSKVAYLLLDDLEVLLF